MKKNNNIIILIMGIIIAILTILCILLATNTISFGNGGSNDNLKNGNSENLIDDKNDVKTADNSVDYSKYVGSWRNDETQNEITIKSISNNTIVFNWFLYRLAGIDEDVSLPLNQNKATFYYQGYEDKNNDGKESDDEKYIRKATIQLNDSSVDVIVEDVDDLNSNYDVSAQFDGASLVKAGTYTHPDKNN